MDKLTIRAALPGDAARLVEIYAPYVQETAITFEYAVPTIAEFSDRIRTTLARYPYLVAQVDGRIVGYAYARAFNERPAADWAVETSLYVDRECLHCGIGKALHSALEAALRAQGILNMNACIAVVPGQDAHLDRNSADFHAHLGYRFVGEFHQCGYKFGHWYNLIWMEKHIAPHLPEQPPIRTFPQVRQSLGL